MRTFPIKFYRAWAEMTHLRCINPVASFPPTRCSAPICSVLRPMMSVVSADDWPHWRGPNRDSHVSESSGWDAKGWSWGEAWQVDVGEFDNADRCRRASDHDGLRRR
ncbi:MAG: hypothetical protein R3C05_02765 [Pirellulaceae bacterium]